MISTQETPLNTVQPSIDDHYDVVILGGGPAGATAATLIAECGISVLVLERAALPRFHVGESLIPDTYHTLHRLGLIERLKESRFPKKYSVQFVTEGGHETRPFYFDEHDPHESSQTWQVERGPFDQLLIENARERGAVIRTDAHVRDVIFEGPRATGVKVRLGAEDAVRDIGARVVIDATGQSAFLMNRLGLKVVDNRLRKGTVWSYFQGAVRDSGKDEGATIILQTEGKKSWFWYIPLPDDVVSVGCTGGLNYMFDGSKASAEQIFERELARCPALQRRLEPSRRVTEFLTTRDFSYRTSQGAGDGWLMIGDALGFIDPVYSSGVYLALKSGEMAADDVVEAIQQNDVSAGRLGAWQPRYQEGVDMFRKLVYAFYAPEFSFAKFFKAHPDQRRNLTDILVGNVFKPGISELFEVMGEVLPPPDVTEAAPAI